MRFEHLDETLSDDAGGAEDADWNFHNEDWILQRGCVVLFCLCLRGKPEYLPESAPTVAWCAAVRGSFDSPSHARRSSRMTRSNVRASRARFLCWCRR